MSSFFGKILSKQSDNNQNADDTDSSVFNSFKSSLRKTRKFLNQPISKLFSTNSLDQDTVEELETSLIMADVGIKTTSLIIDKLQNLVKQSTGSLDFKSALRSILIEHISRSQQDIVINTKPFVILIVGVNGAGKTTTIGKLANLYKQQGKKVMLAAGDTFRAAAVSQLSVWANKLEIPMISQSQGADSASVIFDAISAAVARDIDILIADTAGRLQNKDNLMLELSKISRVAKKIDASMPHETILILDATTGQNALSQAEHFKNSANINSLIVTKLDGSSKGGMIFALQDQFGLPIRFLGLGEKVNDLRSFNAEYFVDAILAED